jgi:limonene-1,2-epoxide hydrolase
MSHETSPDVQVVLTFIDCFNDNRIDDAMALLDEQIFYHNIPMEPMIGREAVNAFTRGFGIGARFKTEWTVTNIAGRDDVVLTERVDAFITADGSRIQVPLMGSFKVSDGLITEWRDYFDLADFENQLAALEASRVPAMPGGGQASPGNVSRPQLPWPSAECG